MTTGAELGKIVEGAEKAYNGKEYEKAVDLVDKFLGPQRKRKPAKKLLLTLKLRPESTVRRFKRWLISGQNTILWQTIKVSADEF